MRTRAHERPAVCACFLNKPSLKLCGGTQHFGAVFGITATLPLSLTLSAKKLWSFNTHTQTHTQKLIHSNERAIKVRKFCKSEQF